MFNQKPPTKKKDDTGFISRVIGAVTEETEKLFDSLVGQVTGDSTANADQSNPIAEAMQQKTEVEGIEKQNKINRVRKHIRTQEALDNELKMIRQKAMEAEKARAEETERQFKVIDPGESMEEKPLPLTSKPKRGMMQGKPGTSKGETGPEVRKSKQ